MKAGILEKIEQLVVGVVPDPQLESGSVIIRVKTCSICGADLRIYHHGHPRIELPHILGHEIAGEIECAAGVCQGHIQRPDAAVVEERCEVEI